MASELELARLASMANALRPDWPAQAVKTCLHPIAAGAYQDIAVALAWVATDPATETPKRLMENGPWWQATRRGTASGEPPPRQDPLAVPDADPDDVAGYVRAVREKNSATPRRDTARPPWCGKCNRYSRHVDDGGVARRCPDCHPLARSGAAS